MRMCNLSLQQPVKSWSPQFKVRKTKPKPEPVGQRNTSVMSHFPTWKGTFRMERLRHYFHVDLASILEVDPEVRHWTADVKPYQFQVGDRAISYRPSFLVTTEATKQALRLVRAGNRKAIATSERHQMLADLFDEIGIEFIVLTDADVRESPRLPVAKEILFHRYPGVPDEIPMAIAAMALAGAPKTLGELEARLGEPGPATWTLVCAAVAEGLVDIDLDAGLSRNTAVLACKLKGYRQ